jgi:hypothetical protein
MTPKVAPEFRKDHAPAATASAERKRAELLEPNADYGGGVSPLRRGDGLCATGVIVTELS